MLPFRLVEQEVNAEAWEILVEGELDLAVAEQLQDALARVGSDRSQTLIGLEDCEFIDSTGIALVMQAHQRFAEEGRRLVLYAPRSQVLRVLSISGLTANGLVFESAAEALAAPSVGHALAAQR
jgi:anti-sigma B factor antagonist